MAKLVCAKCKNTRRWTEITLSKGRNIATCGQCGYKNISESGIEVDTVEGSVTFNFNIDD